MTDRIEGDHPYMTTTQAMQRSGYTRSYLTYLLRNEKVRGFRYPSTREWFIYVDSLEAFLATPRRPGPKGPRQSKREP